MRTLRRGGTIILLKFEKTRIKPVNLFDSVATPDGIQCEFSEYKNA